MNKFRHELKYEINHFQMIRIIDQLFDVLELDNNLKNNDKNEYRVRSLYFDNFFNDYYYENENGVNNREKIRMRIYDNNYYNIKIEIKGKQNNLTYKESKTISKKMAEKIIDGSLKPGSDKLLNKIYLKEQTELLIPKVIVEYDRIPFVCQDGNVRITFDKNVRSSIECERFFDEEIYSRCIMPLDTYIMEVKFDEFLPDYIYRLIQMDNIKQITFSKYYLCRKYGGIN